MKIIVLNGSPKSENSVTVQSIRYIEKNFPKFDFEYVDISKQIKEYEKDKDSLLSLCRKVEGSYAVIWAFPVYHLLVQSDYKRFIEIVFENKMGKHFSEVYTSVFSTSINYYDVSAHQYVNAICDDLGMNYVEGLSHNMNSIFEKEKRRELVDFFENLIFARDEKIRPMKSNPKISDLDFEYEAMEFKEKIENDNKIIVIKDSGKDDVNLNNMISSYLSNFKNPVEVYDLKDIGMKGSCIGCLNCAKENKCVYKDGYRQFYDYVIEEADTIVYAGKIVDRYLSSNFKRFFDRSFCYTHIPVLRGKQIGYIISGRVSRVQNLKNILEVYTQSGSNLIGFAGDESCDQVRVEESIRSLAKLGQLYGSKNYFRSVNFFGISGQKIFRDEISFELGGIFKADYEFYRENGLFDYPGLIDRLKYAFRRYFFNRKACREYLDKNMARLMVSGHKRIVESEGGK